MDRIDVSRLKRCCQLPKDGQVRNERARLKIKPQGIGGGLQRLGKFDTGLRGPGTQPDDARCVEISPAIQDEIEGLAGQAITDGLNPVQQASVLIAEE